MYIIYTGPHLRETPCDYQKGWHVGTNLQRNPMIQTFYLLGPHIRIVPTKKSTEVEATYSSN